MKIYYMFLFHEHVRVDHMSGIRELVRHKDRMYISGNENKLKEERERLIEKYGDKDDWEVSYIHEVPAKESTLIATHPMSVRRLR